jgi:hypothetical protein
MTTEKKKTADATAVVPDHVDIEIDGVKYRELEIKGRKYRIGPFSPAVGSMLTLQAPYCMKDEDIFMIVRRNVLNVIYRYPAGFTDAPIKVFEKGSTADSDRWATSEIDVGTVARLVIETMAFNMDPFGGGSKTATDTSVPATSGQPQSQKA